MSLFHDLSRLITGTVGNNMNNDEEDVRKTKENFSKIGRYNEPVENGIIDRELDTAIRGFQRDNDLKQDGFMRPDGETERTLQHEIKIVAAPEDGTHRQPNTDSRIGTINKRAVFEKVAETIGNRLPSPPAREDSDIQIAQTEDNHTVPKPARKTAAGAKRFGKIQ